LQSRNLTRNGFIKQQVKVGRSITNSYKSENGAPTFSPHLRQLPFLCCEIVSGTPEDLLPGHQGTAPNCILGIYLVRLSCSVSFTTIWNVLARSGTLKGQAILHQTCTPRHVRSEVIYGEIMTNKLFILDYDFMIMSADLVIRLRNDMPPYFL